MMNGQKGDTLVRHIVEVTLKAELPPQGQYRQNCAGEEFLPGTIVEKKKGDWFYWAGSVIFTLAALTSPHWAHLVAR